MCKKREPWVASSLDGLLVFSTTSANIDRVGCIEIKIMTARGTPEEARERSKQQKYSQVSLAPSASSSSPMKTGPAERRSVEKFHKLVPSVEHRAQLLHHAATFGVKDVFYCVCSATSFLYVVRVVFPLNVISSHCNILNSVVLSQIGLAYNNEAFSRL